MDCTSKKIIVSYWHSPIKGVPYKHNEEFEYSNEKREEIISKVLALKCAVMLRDYGCELIIWVSEYSFGQR